jgi:hypothetical protein
MEKEINKIRKQAKKHSKDDKKINDSDYKRQSRF